MGKQMRSRKPHKIFHPGLVVLKIGLKKEMASFIKFL